FPHELIVVEFLALSRPFSSRLLQDPETDEVFQESGSAPISCLIRKVTLADRFADQRVRQFDPKQRPRPRRERRPIIASLRRNGYDCRARIMRTASDDLHQV